MSDQFRTKVQQFSSGLKEEQNDKDMLNVQNDQKVDETSQGQGLLYHDRKQTCEKGRQEIDPETGLIYFKYDFGYEFGVIGPNARDDGSDSKRNSLFEAMTGDLRPVVGSEVNHR
jgi:titin